MMLPLAFFRNFFCKNIIYEGSRAAVYSSWFINRWNERIALYKVTNKKLFSEIACFGVQKPIFVEIAHYVQCFVGLAKSLEGPIKICLKTL